MLITQESEALIHCPVNKLHYVPEAILSDHMKKCSWSTNIDSLKEDITELDGNSAFLYEKTCAEVFKIGNGQLKSTTSITDKVAFRDFPCIIQTRGQF